MNKRRVSQVVTAAVLLINSLYAVAESQVVILEPAERRAVSVAKRAAQGGKVVEVDKDLTNWDVFVLRGCWLYKVEVAHENQRVVSKNYTNYCGNADKIRALNEQAREYQRMHR